MVPIEKFAPLISDGFFKSAEDAEAAGRICARAYAGEMQKLCDIFGAGEGEETPEEELEEAEEATDDVESLMALLQEIGEA